MFGARKRQAGNRWSFGHAKRRFRKIHCRESKCIARPDPRVFPRWRQSCDSKDATLLLRSRPAEAKKGLALDPDFGIGYYNLAVNNAYLNQFKEAQEALQQASVRGVEDNEMVMLRYELAFLRGDEFEMSRQATRARGRSGSETWMSVKQANVLFYAGRAREVRGVLRRVITEAELGSHGERAALWQASAAVREA
jgi:hypothetical protein